jgi:hypothetical protein
MLAFAHGTGLLWFGPYGFSAGIESQVDSDPPAEATHWTGAMIMKSGNGKNRGVGGAESGVSFLSVGI